MYYAKSYDFEIEKKQAASAKGGGEFSVPGKYKQYAPDLTLEPIHNEIDLFVDLENQVASGSVTVTVKANGDDVTTISLNAVDFQDVSVEDADGKALSFKYDSERLAITWSDPIKRGDTRRAKISYKVVKPLTGLFFSKPDEGYPDRTWFAATDHETERARYWLPCVDYPEVRPTLDFHLRAESRFTILANGLLQSEKDNGDGTKTAHWKLEQRCPSYLTNFAICDFVEADDGAHGEIACKYYTSKPHTPEHLLLSFGRSKEMMAWMEGKLGLAFPYPKYYQWALPGVGGAMENISLVSWDEMLVLDETLAKEWTWLLDQINLHEMSHSYFGDAIVCRDYAHAWLKESWAVYVETLWLEDSKGREEMEYDFYQNAHAYFNESDNAYSRPIMTREFKSSWEMYDRHLYPGGAVRIHTLRAELGDDVFFAATKDYVNTYAHQTVETDDFRRVMEKHSGRSLAKFFDQWIYQAGYPTIKVSFEYDADKKLGTFHIEQVQATRKDDPLHVFEIATDLGWRIDGVDHTSAIKLTEARHAFSVKMDKEPEQVRFDPLMRAVHRLDFNPGDAKLRAQLTDAKDIRGRIVAAHELAKTGKRENVKAIADAYVKQSFWGTRQQFAKALADSKTNTGIEGLVAALAFEQDGMVLEFLIAQMGNFQDTRIKMALLEKLEGDLPYRATAAAYDSLGKQRDAAPLGFLKEQAAGNSYHGLHEAGAMRGLAATRNAEALDPILARLPYGAADVRARMAAAGAAAELASRLDKAAKEKTREKLEGLLRDEEDKVRMFASRALGTLGEGAAISALEAYHHGTHSAEQVGVEKVLAGLRGKGDSKVAALEKQFEELQAKYRTLEEEISKLKAGDA